MMDHKHCCVHADRTAELVATDVVAIKNNRKDIATNQQNIAANQRSIATNKEAIKTHTQQIDKNIKAIQENMDRFKRLDDYDLKDEATVKFNVALHDLKRK